MAFHNSQKDAIQVSILNDFANGIHAHATGTGKSWIALQLALEFNKVHPTKHIAWICEQKSILTEQFARETIKQKGFAPLLKKFMIFDYAEKKSASWPHEVNSAQIWRKPMLIIINRAFLTSQERYKYLKAPIGLIIHDECHSISNKTTRAFYEFVAQTSPQTRIIGFTATPNTSHEPFKRILSQYSIYDAVCDEVIVPPKIHWLKSHEPISHNDILHVYKQLAPKLPYKKTIVWCGMIDICQRLATTWATALPDWLVAIDTSQSENDGTLILGNRSPSNTYQQFVEANSHAILFCAAKHREGSDIRNVDSCIFLDQVENRNAKTFVQCVGRVLRRAVGKTHGLVLDVSATSSIRICDRLNQYLATQQDNFPFTYMSEDMIVNKKPIQLNTLTMVRPQPQPQPQQQLLLQPKPLLENCFVRRLPQTPAYQERLTSEIALINEKNLMGYIFQALEVLTLAGSVPGCSVLGHQVPHVTRGSCGSSLLCYVLGISNVDPVAYGISFARFLTPYRQNLPDIDYDFPYNRRDEIFLQVQLKWPNRVARISNHVYYHAPSALRESVRRAGMKLKGNKYELSNAVRRLPAQQKHDIMTQSKKLENTFKCYSLHCGGIVFYPEGVPKALRLATARGNTLAQVTLNKHDVAKDKNFKIDILSSRALAQLYESAGFQPLHLETYEYDKATYDMLCRGENLGITLAESPLIRSAFLKVQPKSIDDIAMCLAIIRPAARDVRRLRKEQLSECLNAEFIYDDDAIRLIATSLIDTDEAKADYFRRGLTKEDKKIQAEFEQELRRLPRQKADNLRQKLRNLRAYGFCKSHAYSYAQLVYALAYQKAHNPKKFWEAALKHSASFYKPWVLLYEAYRAGVEPQRPKKSIYATHKQKVVNSLLVGLKTTEEQLRRTGRWNFAQGFMSNCYFRSGSQPGTYEFRGIIASSRVLSGAAKEKTAALFIATGEGQYMNLTLKGKQFATTSKIGVYGIARRTPIKDEIIYMSSQGEFALF